MAKREGGKRREAGQHNTTQHSQHKLLEQETGAGAGVGGGKTESWCVPWGEEREERGEGYDVGG